MPNRSITSNSTRRTKFLAYGDIHTIDHDEGYCAWLLEQLAAHQPDVVVCLGDVINAKAFSAYKNIGVVGIKEEAEYADKHLHDVFRFSRKARHIFMVGNHEERMERAAYEFLDLQPETYMKELANWEKYDYVYHPSGTFRLGQVTFYHGFETSDLGRTREAVDLGVEYGLCVSGHTHRIKQVHEIDKGGVLLRRWIANPGCGLDFASQKLDYMKKKNDRTWGQGIVVGECDEKVRYAGKRAWTAETIVRQMAWNT